MADASEWCRRPHRLRHLGHMSTPLRDLRVWQEAVALAADVVRAARGTARREVKVVTDLLMVTAAELACAIADGAGSHLAEEQRERYRAARVTLLRLETQLAICRQSELLAASTQAQLAARLALVSRLLAGYLAYLESRAATAAVAEGAR
jgi:four helix bundle protein